MEPLRVAHIIGKMGSGGVEAVVMNYYRNIDRSQVQFDFIVDEDSPIPQKEEIEKLGGRIIVVPPYQKLSAYLKKLKQVFKENNYKIVHSHINTLSVFPLYAAKKAGVPVRIAHNHSTAGKGETKRNIMKYSLRPFAKIYPTNYFACTSYAGKWLFGKKVFDKNGIVINNAINVENFKYDQNSRDVLRKEFGLEGNFVIGHIGRFMKQKNHEFIIDIFAKIVEENSDAMLLLIGEDYTEKEKIKEKIKNLKLEGKVVISGPRKDVNKIYSAMDVFLFPSLYEGLGIVAVEAQVSGLPVVASDMVPADTKTTKLITFLSLDASVSVWAKECSKKVDRKDYIEEVKKNGFDIKKEAKHLEELYSNLIK